MRYLCCDLTWSWSIGYVEVNWAGYFCQLMIVFFRSHLLHLACNSLCPLTSDPTQMSLSGARSVKNIWVRYERHSSSWPVTSCTWTQGPFFIGHWMFPQESLGVDQIVVAMQILKHFMKYIIFVIPLSWSLRMAHSLCLFMIFYHIPICKVVCWFQLKTICEVICCFQSKIIAGLFCKLIFFVHFCNDSVSH